jgi:hypothetical protein
MLPNEPSPESSITVH